MNEDLEEVRRLLAVIKTLMRLLGITNREVERRLDLHPSSLTRVFNGQVETKLELVLGIARVMGLHYGELFEIAYPSSGEHSEVAQKLQETIESLRPARNRPVTPAAQPALELLIRQLLDRLGPSST